MGREWLWSSSSSTSSSLAKRDCKESCNAAPPGCMSGVLHYLHFNHLLFGGGSRSPPASSSSLSSSSPLPPRADLAHHEQLKGFEAPRNSLELDEGIKAMSSSTAASAMEDEFCDVPVAIEISSTEGKGSSQQQVETPRSTPGIVARLMGLEISPDHASSPTPKLTPPPQPQVLRIKKKETKKSFDGDLQRCAMRERDSPSPRQPLRSLDRNAAAASSLGFGITSDGAGSRSLPETPRVSLSSARSCDEYPRLSLQLNKENYMTGEYYSLPPSPSVYTAVKTKKRDLGRHQYENKSPMSRHYAREIVEQVKETITSRRGDGGRGDEIKSKSKRTRKTTEKKKLAMAHPPSPRSPPQLMALSNKADEGTKKPLETTKMVLNKCKKADNERFTEKIRRQQTQAPTTLASLFRSADMLSADKNSNPDKNRSQPVPSTYSENSPTRSLTPTLGVAMQQTSNQKKGQGQDRLWKTDGPEFRYIKSIFERAVIAGVRSFRRSSPLLPVDPIIFDELELELPLFIGDLRFRWNRKLTFHLVEEILGDLLLSYSELLSSSTTTHLDTDERFTVSNISAEALLRRVWGQIQSFPAEDNDLDALISRDLPEANVRRLLRHPSVVEEAEDVVFEVEREILDGLVVETVASLVLSSFLPSFQGGGGSGGGVDARRFLSQYCRCVWASVH